MGPGGWAEIQQQERDSSGRERIMMERRIGDQGRRVERKRDAHTGDEETNDETFNLEDEEAFEREFHARMQGGGGYGGGRARAPQLIQQQQQQQMGGRGGQQQGQRMMISDGRSYGQQQQQQQQQQQHSGYAHPQQSRGGYRSGRAQQSQGYRAAC